MTGAKVSWTGRAIRKNNELFSILIKPHCLVSPDLTMPMLTRSIGVHRFLFESATARDLGSSLPECLMDGAVGDGKEERFSKLEFADVVAI